MAILLHHEVQLEGRRYLLGVDDSPFEALILHQLSYLFLLLNGMQILFLQGFILDPFYLLVCFVDDFQLFLQVFFEFIDFVAVSPCIDRTPFIFFKPILFSFLHLSLNPIHTNQSSAGFSFIFGLALPGLFLGMLLYDWIVFYSLLIDIIFLYDGIGLLMNTQSQQDLNHHAIHLSLVLFTILQILKFFLHESLAAFYCDQYEELELELLDQFSFTYEPLIDLLYLLVVLFRDFGMRHGNEKRELHHDCVDDQWMHERGEFCENALRVVYELICSFEVI